MSWTAIHDTSTPANTVLATAESYMKVLAGLLIDGLPEDFNEETDSVVISKDVD